MKMIFAFLLLWVESSSSLLFAERPNYEASAGLISASGYVVFYNSQGPLSYNSMTPSEAPPIRIDLGEVRCKSCQHSFSIPFTSILNGNRSSSLSTAFGNGSFKKILEKLQLEHPGLTGIYDVKVDLHKISILGLYTKVCTEVTALGFQ